MTTDLAIRTFQTLPECAGVAAEMNELNSRSSRPCPFATYEFIRNHWQHDELNQAGRARELFLLAASRGGRLVAYLPLARVTDRFLGVEYERVEFAQTHATHRPHVVCEPEDRESCSEVLLQHLFAGESGWDALELADQTPQAELYPSPALLQRGFYARRMASPPSAILRLRWPSVGEYLGCLNRRFRVSLQSDLRRLLHAGTVELVWAEGEGAKALLGLYLELEERSQKALVNGAIGLHPGRVEFFKGLFAREQPMRTRISLCVLDGIPIAGAIYGLFASEIYALQICLDESFAQLGPGRLCILGMIKQGIDSGVATVNWLHGSTHYKTRWLAEVEPAHRVQVYRIGSAPYARAKLGELRRGAWGILGRGARASDSGRRADCDGLEPRATPYDYARARRRFREIAEGIQMTRMRKEELETMLPTLRAHRHSVAARTLETQATRTPVGPVAIFDADSPPALAFTRSLGRAGVPVCVYSPTKLAAARWSRFSSDAAVCPEPSRPDHFLPWLREQLVTGRIGAVAPTSDLMAYYLSELRDRLAPEVAKAMPDTESALAMLFKDRFQRACAKAGVATPWTLCPESIEEVRDLASTFDYPVIIKPKSHVAVGWQRGVVVETPAALATQFRPYEIGAENAAVLARYPGLRLPMIQEYVPGALDNLFSVSGLLGTDGEVIALAGVQKTSQWPPALGIGTMFRSCDTPELLAVGKRAAQALVKRGLFELELIFDARTSRYLAIDLNPRAFGQIGFDIARGNDLPLLWHRLIQGQVLGPQPLPEKHVCWIHSLPYHIGALVGLAMGPGRIARLGRYLHELGGGVRHVDIVNDWTDPLPSVIYTAKMLRHPGGLVRPFLARHANR